MSHHTLARGAAAAARRLRLAPAAAALALIAAGPVFAEEAAAPATEARATEAPATEAPAAETQAEAPAVVEAPAPETVVATIGGEEITLAELAMMRADLPEQYQQLPAEQLIDALLQRVAVEKALSDKALAAGLQDDEDVKLREKIQRRGLLAEAWMRKTMQEVVTEEAIQAAYDETIKDMEPTPEVRASHILVPEKEKAEALKAEIEGGAAFADVAKENGTDGTKARGGDLGWFEKGQMVPEFAEAAFGAEEGALVGPVQTQFGWHLIEVTGKRDKPIPTLEELRPQLTAQLSNAAAQEEITAARANAEIKRVEAPAEETPAETPTEAAPAPAQ